MADHCAGVRAAFYLAGVEREVADGRVLRVTEEADIVCGTVVDIKPEYTVSETVEASGEGVIDLLSQVELSNRVEAFIIVIFFVGGRVRVDGVAECVPTAFVLVHRLQLV